MCKEGVSKLAFCMQLLVYFLFAYKFTRNESKIFNPKFIYNTTRLVRSLNRTTQVINNRMIFQENVKLSNIRVSLPPTYIMNIVI